MVERVSSLCMKIELLFYPVLTYPTARPLLGHARHHTSGGLRFSAVTEEALRGAMPMFVTCELTCRRPLGASFNRREPSTMRNANVR